MRMFCRVCHNDVREFLPYGLPPRRGRCPHCQAKPRNRATQWYLQNASDAHTGPGREVLEVGPSRLAASMHRNAVGGARYTAIDTRCLPFHAKLTAPHRFLQMGVTDLQFEDDRFDLLLCNNVLPYVADFTIALSEMYRCLKPGGLAMLNTPMSEQATCTVAQYRDAHPQLADEYFAENGDQWVFGSDLLKRVEEARFVVRVETPFASWKEEHLRHNGLSPDITFILAAKSTTAFD